jgi:dTDP-4-amino-4,6-dideoxygalactose transaminase
LRISGEVITTPFSFVATSHVLTWSQLQPVFVDVNQNSFNLDPEKIEEAITSKTSAILPVHVYGRPCDVDRISEIAKEYNLKVIYDAAHAFGVKYRGQSVLNFGDLSILSFHATKIFNTFEGGAIACPTPEMKLHVDRLKNFGFVDDVTVTEPGINGKMNEFQAALGLLQLKHVGKAIRGRRLAYENYIKLLSACRGIVIPDHIGGSTQNYSYFPIIIMDDYHSTRDQLYERLQQHDIFCRRYFYPLISDFSLYRQLPSSTPHNLRVAHNVASRVLCLPMSSTLSREDVERICSIIISPPS